MTLVTRRHEAQRGARLVTAWVRLYTSGLRDDIRDDRRDEIASDIWEQAHDNATSSTQGAEIVARAVLGVPADLSWRLEHSRLARMPGWAIASVLGLLARLETAGRWVARRGLPGFSTMTASVVGVIGLLVIVTAPTNNSGTPVASLVWWGSLLLVGGLTIGLGGRLIDARPRLGGTLVILGSALSGLLLWPTILAPIAAFALAWRSALRIKRGRKIEPVLPRS